MISWVQQLDYLVMYGIYAGVLAALGITGLPLLYIYGKQIRGRCGKFVRDKGPIAGF